jgi:hypothetical protein
MSTPLERLICEAREDLGRQAVESVDWSKVERGLFARIQREDRTECIVPHLQRIVWTMGAVALSAAAAAALIIGRASEHRGFEATQGAAHEAAGNLVSVEGDGEVLVDGKPAAPGATLRLGDVVEARGAARATVERPGKVTFVLEGGARAAVEHVQGALVLSLERGGVEAQVVPVPQGEAFAVDVGHSRVAVHGTHLRITRQGDASAAGASVSHASDLVVIDLSEGVVLVGEAPRLGSTSGMLVVAPAHAEFAADDAQGTLRVTHDLAKVRPPVGLGPLAQPTVAPAAAVAVPLPHTDSSDVHTPSALAASPHAEARSPSGNIPPQVSSPDPDAEASLAAAIRACFAERPSAANVTVSVFTTLRLNLRDDGTVQSARFDPPVAPDVNACAVQSIYRTRFAHGGSASVSVDFREPSSSAR